MLQVSPETEPFNKEFCVYQAAEPCSVILFGASGDLAHRKLIPALFDLKHQHLVPQRFFLLGTGRGPADDAAFQETVAATMKRAGKDALDAQTAEAFTKACHFLPADFDDPAKYQALARRLSELEQQYRTGGNRIFYLAIPPTFYGEVIKQLAAAGLTQRSGTSAPWGRVIIEKPIGRDLESAQGLMETIRQVLHEDQTYRIDHYLGKETVQNVLILRYANAIFEPLWNRRYIDHVQITVAETLGVEHRAGYYDHSGCLRDMFQNHLLQLLCLVAMEPPATFEADRVRDETVKVLRAVRPFPVDRWQEALVRGRYGAGTMDKARVPAYLDEEGVPPSSTTETFIASKFFIDNWRWQDVPFYLRSGKRMARRVSDVVIRFKAVPHSLFRGVNPEALSRNTLILRIQPNEGIGLTFEAKYPGPKLCMSSASMDFNYQQAFGVKPPGAYEHLLLESMLGDQTLFARQDWVELSWGLLTPLLKAWEAGRDAPATYDSGSWGPREADELVQRNGHRWHNPDGA